jgi:hypothetical protein
MAVTTSTTGAASATRPTSLDETTLAPATVCPNGASNTANRALRRTLAEMLDAPGAPKSWAPAVCLCVGG